MYYYDKSGRNLGVCSMDSPSKLNQVTDENLKMDVHQRYLKAKKKETKWVRLWQLAILLLFLSLWELASRLKWIDVLLFSYPTKVFQLLWEKLLDGTLLPHVAVTVEETIIGFFLGTIFGT